MLLLFTGLTILLFCCCLNFCRIPYLILFPLNIIVFICFFNRLYIVSNFLFHSFTLLLFFNNLLTHFVKFQTCIYGISLLHGPLQDFKHFIYEVFLNPTCTFILFKSCCLGSIISPLSLFFLFDLSSLNVLCIPTSTCSSMKWILHLFNCCLHILTFFRRLTSIFFPLAIFSKVQIYSYNLYAILIIFEL